MDIFSGITTFQLLTNLTTLDTCTTFYDSPVDLSLPDVKEIVSYIQSQLFTLEDIETVAVTEAQDIKDAIAYHKASSGEDVSLNLTQLIQKYGNNVEEHTVTTEDGYILYLLRIPGKGKPIYLQHGLFTNAADWVTAGPENGLSSYLAAQGYDVWLGNTRGSKYSQKHVKISTKCAEFWQFSFHEIGYYDLAAIIDYILDKTGYEQLVYMGHSQGGTSAYVLLSERDEYNKKVSLFVDFAPVAWMSHLKSPITRLFALNPGILYKLLNLLGTHQLSLDNPIINLLLKVVCNSSALSEIACSNILFLLYGFDRAETNVTQLPVIINNIYASSSTKQAAHYGQLILSDKFRQFDYGTTKNIEYYGEDNPPEYDLSKITVPVSLIYAGNDWFSSVNDVKNLLALLPNLIECLYLDSSNHVTHVYGKNLKSTPYPFVMSLLDKYL